MIENAPPEGLYPRDGCFIDLGVSHSAFSIIFGVYGGAKEPPWWEIGASVELICVLVGSGGWLNLVLVPVRVGHSIGVILCRGPLLLATEYATMTGMVLVWCLGALWLQSALYRPTCCHFETIRDDLNACIVETTVRRHYFVLPTHFTL